MESSVRQSCGLGNLQRATARYQEVTQSIRDDPRLLSLLEKRRGQKGFRELQGDSLRHSLEAVLSSLVCTFATERTVCLTYWLLNECLKVLTHAHIVSFNICLNT